MQAPTKTTEIGLVLQGGGALGAYEYGAITALLELIDEAAGKGRAVSLKAVTGVSIGAINAACVVGAATRTDARRRLASLESRQDVVGVHASGKIAETGRHSTVPRRMRLAAVK